MHIYIYLIRNKYYLKNIYIHIYEKVLIHNIIIIKKEFIY